MNQLHHPIIHEVEGSKTAFIFVHGILSSPRYFQRFLPMVPENCSVYNILLSGHGGSVQGFSQASMIAWQKQVNEIFARAAAKHEKLFVVAHSMGTLLSYQAAKRYPQKIAQLFYMAVPLVPRVGKRSLDASYKIVTKRVSNQDVWAVAARDAYSIDIDRRLWLYLGWLPRFLELFKKMGKTNHIMANNRLPVIAFQSRLDELVSGLAVEMLKKKPNVTCYLLPNSGHQYYPQKDWEKVEKAFLACVKSL